MAYRDFTLPRVVAEFGLTVQTVPNLFGHLPPAPLPPALRDMLTSQEPLALAVNTEKVRSELLIAPLLAEVWRRGQHRVALFSGVAFNVDEAAGLNGVADFILGRPPQLHYVTAPVMVIVEAKNEDIPGGMGQCAAIMVAAQRFNRVRNPDIDTLYGCVSDGAEWKFLRLREALCEIDLPEYHIRQADQILGILLHFVGVTPATPAAA